MSNFAVVIPITLRFEGGTVNDPKDPGGATNMGITLAGLSEWRGHRCSVAEIWALTRPEAIAIYLARYWNPMRCSDLPAGLDLVVFDFGVNAGPGRSIPMLQRVVGEKPDGLIGPKTIAAAQGSGDVLNGRIRQLTAAHEAYYHQLPGFAHDGRGWTARTQACCTAALAMAGGDNMALARPTLPKPRALMPWTPLPADPVTADLNEASYAATQKGPDL